MHWWTLPSFLEKNRYKLQGLVPMELFQLNTLVITKIVIRMRLSKHMYIVRFVCHGIVWIGLTTNARDQSLHTTWSACAKLAQAHKGQLVQAHKKFKGTAMPTYNYYIQKLTLKFSTAFQTIPLWGSNTSAELFSTYTERGSLFASWNISCCSC